jgi:branched-chain amino acid transport system ATP-binding protein
VSEAGDSAPSEDVPLVLSNVRVRYHNGALGVVDVSLEVGPNQIVALFGPNGAGKTTTVRAISGFLRSEGARVIGGTVRVFGQDVTNREPHRVSRLGVAFVPERQKVFANLTVAENLVALGTRQSRAELHERQEYVFDLFPILRERLRMSAGRMSGGQQQMLAIARSLMTRPRFLVVDEMTLGLHHSLQAPLFEAVKRVSADGTAVLLVDESTGFGLEVADHCYLMRSGAVRSSGPADKYRGSELLAAGYVE